MKYIPLQTLPKIFILGNSASIAIRPHLKKMLDGVYDCTQMGGDSSDHAADPNIGLSEVNSTNTKTIAGDTTQVLTYLKTIEKSKHFCPDIVLLHLGAHDIKKEARTNMIQVSISDYKSNVAAILDWFGKRDIKLIWIRMGPIDEALHNSRSANIKRFQADLDHYNQTAELLVSQRNITILDLKGFTENLEPIEGMLTDHIHFNENTVKHQAAFISGYLLQFRLRHLNTQPE